MLKPRFLLLLMIGLFLVAGAGTSIAQEAAPILPNIGIDGEPNRGDISITLQILFLLTVLSLLPSILVMTTSFIRISVVLGFVRRAIGTQQTPSNEIIVGLSIFMTFFIMMPVFDAIYDTSLGPYLSGELQGLQVGDLDPYGETVTNEMKPFYVMMIKSSLPMRQFMFEQIGTTGAGDIKLFMDMANMEEPSVLNDIPTHVLIPAFMISELKKAFMMGFFIFVPFLILDLVTSSILISMGMFQLPPAFISLPFKILLFVLADGWSVLANALGTSFIQNMGG